MIISIFALKIFSQTKGTTEYTFICYIHIINEIYVYICIYIYKISTIQSIKISNKTDIYQNV